MSITICRFVIVDCVTYPHAVFSHQCQVFPYNLATPTLTTPLSSAVVLYQIAQTQVSGGGKGGGRGGEWRGEGRWERGMSGGGGGGRGDEWREEVREGMSGGRGEVGEGGE